MSGVNFPAPQIRATVLAALAVVTAGQNATGNCPNRRSYATCFCNPDDRFIVGGGPRCGTLANCPSDYADACAVMQDELNDMRLAQNLSLPYYCMRATWMPNDLGDGDYQFEAHPGGQVAPACVMSPARVNEMQVCPWLQLGAVVECQCHSEALGYHNCGILARCPMETLNLPDSSSKCLFFLDAGTGVMGGRAGRYYCHEGFGHGGIAAIYPISHPKCCNGPSNITNCAGEFRAGQICEGEDDWCFTPITTPAPASAWTLQSRGVFLFLAVFQIVWTEV